MPQLYQPKTELRSPFIFSQSSLQDYADCARRFQLRYIEQLQWPAVETAPILENEHRLMEGQQFHRMLQQHLLGLPAEKLARMANTESLSRWWQNWLDFRNADEQRDLSSLHPEISLSAPIGTHRLIAKYDLISVKDGRATIYDWKTYQKRPGDAAMAQRFQSKVYQALLVLAGAHLNNGQPFAAGQVEMVYWYADFPSEPTRLVYSTERFTQDWATLNNQVSELSAKQSFPPTGDEKKCAFCVYRSYCARGIAAGQGQYLEDGQVEIEVNLEQIQEIEF
jgi:RecB family exonuclease